MHKYRVVKVVPSRLKDGRPIIILYKEGASITKYLSFISLARFCSPKVILRVIYLFTCTCYPQNPTNDPLKGLKSFGSRSLSNASQYNISAKLPWLKITLLISHYLHLTVMNTGLSL